MDLQERGGRKEEQGGREGNEKEKETDSLLPQKYRAGPSSALCCAVCALLLFPERAVRAVVAGPRTGADGAGEAYGGGEGISAQEGRSSEP